MAKITTTQIFRQWAGLWSGMDWVGQTFSGNFMDLDWMDLNFHGLDGLDLFEENFEWTWMDWTIF